MRAGGGQRGGTGRTRPQGGPPEQLEGGRARLDTVAVSWRARTPANDASDDVANRATEELAAAHEELRVTAEELRVTAEELRVQNTELAREQQRSQELFEQAPDAYVVTDQRGVIGAANIAAVRLFGVSAQRLRGKPLELYLPGAQQHIVSISRSGVVVDRLQEEWEANVRARGGGRVAVGVRCARVEQDGGEAIRWLLRDLTERHRAEQHARKLLQEQAAREAAQEAERNARFLADLSRALVTSIDIDATLAEVTRRVVDVVADVCIIDVVTAGQHEQRAAAHRDSARATALLEHRPDYSGAAERARALRSGETHVVPAAHAAHELGLDDDDAELLWSLGIRSVAAVPLTAGAVVHGIMTVGASTNLATRLTLIRELADRTGSALERAQLFAALHDANTSLRIRDAERRRAEAALRGSEERYRSLAELSPDAILVSAGDMVVYANPAAAPLLGAPDAAALVGRSLFELVLPAHHELVRNRCQQLLAGEIVMPVEQRWRRLDGSEVDVEVSTSLTLWEGGPAFQLIARDVSERQRTLAVLAEALGEAERQGLLAETARAALQRAQVGLEVRIAERTAELARANEALSADVEERRRNAVARSALLRQLASAEEEERRRIARELHDQMGQLVTALQLGLKSLELAANATDSRARIVELEKLAERIARETQHLALALRPPALDRLGLSPALQTHLEEWSEQTSIGCDFHSAGLTGTRLPPEVETALYRVIQEGLTNVLKHAGATHVSLIVERRQGYVVAILEDNGRGFDVEDALASPAKAKRLGLRGMRERVAMLDGTLEIESSPSTGTTLFVRVPDGG